MTTLIAGVGYVGSIVAEMLVARGKHVIGMRRRGLMPKGVEPIYKGVHDAALRLPPSITRVVYALSAGERSEAAYRSVYRDGLSALLDTLERSGATVERAIFVSSTAVFDENEGGIVDERSSVTRQGTAGVLVEAESVLQTRLGNRGLTLRLSGIYGPGRDRIVRMVKDGSARCAHPSPIGNRIHRDDCAGAIVHLLELPNPEPVYIGSDEASVELCEVYRWIATELEVAPPIESAEPDARGRGAFKRIDGSKLRASGYAFRYPTYREGYGEIIRVRDEADPLRR